MAKAVATEGDVSPEGGTIDPMQAKPGSGKWTPDPKVSYTFYDELTIGGKKVIYEASLKFTYIGGTLPDGKPLPPPLPDETVTLKAKATVVQSGESKVLLDGDEEKSLTTGNKLTVSTQNHMTSD
jgi:hypothetical protein